MSQSCFSLGFHSQNSFCNLSTFHGIKGIYTCVRMECEESVFQNRAGWRLGLQLDWVASSSCELTEWPV